MGAPRLTQATPSYAPGSRHTFLIGLGICLTFGSWCATQYSAYRLGFRPELGAPAYVLPDELRMYVRGVLSLCLGAAIALVAVPKGRRLSPALLLTAVVLQVLLHSPVYGPIRYFLWSHAFRQRPELAAAFAHGRLVLAAGTFLALIAGSPLSRHGRMRRASGAFGTAKWGDGARLVRNPEGLELGRRLGDGEMLRYAGDGHLITLVPTGGGKGVSAVIPALLHYPGSILVPDVKPELYAVTARRRREMGQTVVCIDGWDVVGGTDGLNPMDLIDPKSPDALDDAEIVADMLVTVGEQSARDRHWNEEALAFLTGLVLHVKTTAPPELQNLPYVRKLVMLPRGTPEEPGAFEQMLGEMLKNRAIHDLISRRAAALTQKAEAERSGVISAAQSHTHFLDSPRMQRVLSRTTFDLGELKTGRMTVYVVIPARRLPRYNRLLRLVIGSAFIRISSIPGRPRHRTLVLLDEFPQLKRLGPVEEAFRLHRGYGVWFWLFVQDLAAFEEVYPRTWRSFLANAGVLQAFGTNDSYTAEELSKRAGETTIFVESENRSRGVSQGRMDNVQEGSGQTMSEKGRRLIFAHEITTMDPDEEMQLLFVQGEDPHLARRIVYYEDTAYEGQYDPNPQYQEVAG
jgi:type IV secretion system protein VirD4